jgi:predicted dehydrogenase
MIRLAVIGMGAVTRNIHLPAYRLLGDRVKLVGGCDVDEAARKAAGEAGYFPEIFDDPEDMLGRTKPDVVSICTPPFLHYQQCLMALEHGCHVFCEKPLAEDLGEIDRIIEAARLAQRLVVVNSQFPYMNIHRSAKRYINSPQFGRLLFLHAWQTVRPTARTEAGWRAEMKRRLCFEFGVHVCELIRFFFDDTPVRIWSHMPNPSPTISSEVINVISMEFRDGRAASVMLDRVSKGPEQYLEMRLNGEHASIHTSIGGEARIEMGVHTHSRRPFLGVHFIKGGKAVLQNGECSVIIGKDGLNPFASATAAHLGSFLTAIQTGSAPQGTAMDHRDTLALVFAAYDSAQFWKAIDLAPYRCTNVAARDR